MIRIIFAAALTIVALAGITQAQATYCSTTCSGNSCSTWCF
jgi:hypothetical protein